MVDLRNKIRNIIETESKKETANENSSKHFSVLNEEAVNLIQQILDNYEVTNDLKKDESTLPKKANLIFLAAPTGSGKDSLVSRINYKEQDKKYIELNMDKFRYYYKEFKKDSEVLTDKNFAIQSNEFSYEMYYTIQEILLEEFPGTNIIITGTLWQTDWVESVFKKYKSNKKTNYDIELASLAVPYKDSEYSVLYRYIKLIDEGINKETGEYEDWFTPGSVRYTTLDYHNQTFKKFPDNLKYFQNKFENGELVDSMSVYRRADDKLNMDEDTLIYSSKRPEDSEKNAVDTIYEFRRNKEKITLQDFTKLNNMIANEKNFKYLCDQGIVYEILNSLVMIIGKQDIEELSKKEGFDDFVQSIKKLKERLNELKKSKEANFYTPQQSPNGQGENGGR